MRRTVQYLWGIASVPGLILLGALLVMFRYMLRTPQPLESAIPGEARLFKWTYGHIFYKVLGGEDAPPLVLLHAPEVAASAYEMRGLVTSLAEHYRVYVPDLLGFGLSDHPNIPYSATLYTELCRDFLSQEVARPATLLASGLSCNYCLALAVQRPDLCEAAILLSPDSFFEPKKRSWFSPLLHTPLVGLVWYAFLTNRAVLRYVLARQQGTAASQVASSDLAYAFAVAHQLGAPYAARAFLADELALDVAQQIKRVTLPVLFIWGERAFASHAISLTGKPQDVSGSSRTVCIPDASRRVQQASPMQVVAAIRAWHAERQPGNAQEETVELDAYCVKCKQKRSIQNATDTITKNGRRAKTGSCAVCGTKLFRFLAG